jgi:hypothetical protein
VADIRGYLCDGGCGAFHTTQPAAIYEHNAWITDGDVVKRMQLNAQLCEPCAIRVSQESLGENLYSLHEVHAAISEGENDDNDDLHH